MLANTFTQPLLDAWRGFLERLPFLAEGAVTLLVFYLLARAARFLVERSASRMKRSEHAARLLSRLAFYAVVSAGAVAALAVMGVNPARLATSLGLLGVALGFALREVIENFIAGLILLMQRPFTVGDQITFGDYEGIVEDVRVRDTVIRLYDGRLVFAPNAQIFKGPVVNNTSSRRRRVDFEVLIKHEEDVDTALDAAAGTLRGDRRGPARARPPGGGAGAGGERRGAAGLPVGGPGQDRHPRDQVRGHRGRQGGPGGHALTVL